MKQWFVKPKISEELINKFPEINPVILQLLAQRDLNTQAGIDEFLFPDYSQDIHDPYLFTHMATAVARIYLALARRERAVIYGDYDADGVCGSAILAKTLKKIGLDFEVYLPSRELEGYGLNQKAINELALGGAKLIVTVDCGISNTAEVALANSLGLDVIITDHHHVSKEEPAAVAIIHPGWDKAYPFNNLAGGGAAFKFAQAIIKSPQSKLSPEEQEIFEKWLLDLVAISTVADMVPLIGENRTLVKHGLIVLSKTKNIGLQKLIEVSGLSPDRLDNYAIGWQLAPRINAAGRMEHANAAYKLLTTENIEEAITIAHSLNKSNQERQVLTERLINESIAQLGEIDERLPVLFVQGQDWPIGIIGLVASKLTNKFARPAIVLSGGADELVASGRSIVEFNLIEALDEFKSYLARYGGHSAAAGFTIKAAKLFEFKEKFTSFAQNKLAGVQFLPRVHIDAEIKLAQIDWRLVEALADFEPFGQGNHKPKFLISGLTLMSVETVGLESKHLRLMVQEGSLQRKVICFGFGEANDLLAPGGKVDLVCEAGVNEWNGKKELQLSLVDYRKIV